MVMIYPHSKYLLQNRPFHLTTFVIVNGKNNGLTTNASQKTHFCLLSRFFASFYPKANFCAEPLKIVCSQTKFEKTRKTIRFC